MALEGKPKIPILEADFSCGRSRDSRSNNEEFVNHDHHDYYDKSDEINSDAWKFFKENPLLGGQ